MPSLCHGETRSANLSFFWRRRQTFVGAFTCCAQKSKATFTKGFGETLLDKLEGGGGGEHKLKALGFEQPCAVRTHNRLLMCIVVKSPLFRDPNASNVKVKVSVKESTVWAWCVNVDKTFRPNARNDGTGYKGNHCAMGRLYL